ncbi:MAG: hypothetical protein QXI12_09925 [Candidatus Methanomethyliaceae archaeon]
MLHAVREALNQTRRADWEDLAEVLKTVYRAEVKRESLGNGVFLQRSSWSD